MLDQLLRLVGPEAIGIGVAIVSAIGAYLGGRNADARKAVLRAETVLRKRLRNHSLPVPAQTELDDEVVESKVIEFTNARDADLEMATFDGTYFAPSPADRDALRLIGEVISIFPYRPERFDCENYAFFFKSLTALIYGVNTVGVVVDWSSTHAYSIIVYDDGTHELYDPQHDRFVEPGESYNGVEYNFERVDIYL